MGEDLTPLVQRVRALAAARPRVVVAVAGAPGAGKSTLVEQLQGAIERDDPALACTVVPMDGFHFDNAVLDARGQRARKGMPFTFDFAGYHALIRRIRDAANTEIAVPLFDRDLDLARAGARLVTPQHRVVLTEGNYLLLDEAPWSALAGCFDLTVFLNVPDAVLEARLVQRWRDHGYDEAGARRRAHDNDMVNVAHVVQRSREPDLRW
ncbi:MAG: nucleoside triphosphate hydrolase [Rhodanobacter sp.]|nr:MAG: nucleoside triphosphate hydrolase [Rhodanobacter sp.]TAM42918.1 MAG: nucleoside triphosphate hydrolase [Rhodanobacter sp.]